MTQAAHLVRKKMTITDTMLIPKNFSRVLHIKSLSCQRHTCAQAQAERSHSP